MNWISRFTARIGSALALLSLVSLATSLPAKAGAPERFEYQNRAMTFTHIAFRHDAKMLGVEDPGFHALLKSLGAYLTWKPGARYVLIATAQPQIISFSVGNTQYDVGPVTSQAQVAPYFKGREVYLPLDEVLQSLDLAAKRDGITTILQPQLAALDVKSNGNRVSLVAHAGSALKTRVVSQSTRRVVYAFEGVGSTLPPLRTVDAGGIRRIAISTKGTLRAPETLVSVTLAPGTQIGVPRSNNGDDFEVSFSGSSGAPLAAEQSQQSQPVATALPAPAAGTAQVSAITVQPTSDGMRVAISISGDATYSWHRLRAPDNRFWIDISDAQLVGPPLAQAEPNPLVDLRARQIDATTVRVALSLSGQNALTISPSPVGLTIDVGNQEVVDASRDGSGSVGTTVSVSEAQPLVTPAPPGETPPFPGPWKFGPQAATYVPTNPNLIVIDPGHGGSDRGAVRHGTAEATLTLDMAHRLRDLLVAQGWQVKLTHTTDVDVYAPNDTARQELQARDDIANNAGARMFISIHCNAFINSGPSGTTTYYSKPSDVPLAQIMDRSLANDGTKDDGIVKSHLWVTLHAFMPAVLVETAFLSNPSDYALLTSPDWRQKVAQDMANGIYQYAQEYPVAGSGAQ